MNVAGKQILDVKEVRPEKVDMNLSHGRVGRNYEQSYIVDRKDSENPAGVKDAKESLPMPSVVKDASNQISRQDEKRGNRK